MNKLFLKTNELCEYCNIGRTKFYEFQNQWISCGRDLSEMGRISFGGKRETPLWDVKLFIKWLYEWKVNKPAKYIEEVHNQKIAVAVVKHVQRKVK